MPLPASAPEQLVVNAVLLDAAEIALACSLLECGQEHLFDAWDPPGVADDEKHAFFDEVAALDAAYPGGIGAYIARARTLFAAATRGDNPLKGWEPSLPPPDAGVALEPATPEFLSMEKAGLEEAIALGFVVVAGGIGERLGFSGIKLALPTEISTGTTVLQLYCSHIVALQAMLTERLGRTVRLPLAIMTSSATHAATLEMLQAEKYYGLSASQVLRACNIACVQLGL